MTEKNSSFRLKRETCLSLFFSFHFKSQLLFPKETRPKGKRRFLPAALFRHHHCTFTSLRRCFVHGIGFLYAPLDLRRKFSVNISFDGFRRRRAVIGRQSYIYLARHFTYKNLEYRRRPFDYRHGRVRVINYICRVRVNETPCLGWKTRYHSVSLSNDLQIFLVTHRRLADYPINNLNNSLHHYY